MHQIPVYISLAEAARLAGFSRKYLNVLVYRKKIRVDKVGGQWFLTREWLNDYLRMVRRPEVTAEAGSAEVPDMADKFVDAYIQQNKFLQEQFGKLVDDKIAGSIQKQDGSEIIELQSRLDQLYTELHQEQTDKQALLFELQHLHEQMEETIGVRLANMAEELNRKIMDAKVNERLEQMNERFEKDIQPIEQPELLPRLVSDESERAASSLEKEEEPPLFYPALRDLYDKERVGVSSSELVPLRSTPFHRHIKYHTLRIWDQRPKRKYAVASVVIVVALFVNFASVHPGSFLGYPAMLGLAYGEAVNIAAKEIAANFQSISKPQFSARASFVKDFVATIEAPEVPYGLRYRAAFLYAAFSNLSAEVAGARSTNP